MSKHYYTPPHRRHQIQEKNQHHSYQKEISGKSKQNSLLNQNSKFIGKINQTTTNDLFGVLLLQQEMFDEIFTASGPLAVSNEFQFHYTALIGTLKNQGQEIAVSIPLVCYNYKQTVSGAHIAFNLEEVETMSDETLSIAQMKASEFLESDTRGELETIFGELTWEITTLQAMHRHPGGARQGFSGTDYQDNPDMRNVLSISHLSCMLMGTDAVLLIQRFVLL